MKSRFFLLISFLLIIFQQGFAQITTEPVIPIQNQAVKIIFDATEGTAGLANYTGDIYAHTGVITDKSTSVSDWKYVIADWEVNLEKAKLTRISTNIYELTISPDIRSFYGVPEDEQIKQMAFVFRSEDGSLEGKATGSKDILVDVFNAGLNVSITSPNPNSIFQENENIQAEVITSTVADLSLLLNNIELTSTNADQLTHNFSITEAGNYWLKITATANEQTVKDSVFITISTETVNEARPAAIRDGINYIDNQTVTLSLFAPHKNYIYVIGDFNDWLPNSNYQMKKDGDHFWLTIPNLNPQQEYVFQYLIDGDIKIGDPYCDKVSDPFDDQYISASVYPNLIDYPADKTEGRASVIQTGQDEYEWQTVDFSIPAKEKLHIYELLIRDFTAEKTYRGVLENLDYLERLGVNAIELMPFSEFEGNSSWGYNPNYYFAPDKAYGTKDDLKELIDSCHHRGFIVIQDIVLNHAYNSCPLVKMYWDDANNQPAADNPWFNTTSPNTSYSWGSDFNHESIYTQQFVDSVTSYWLNEYNMDGFRFDFTKGFTNTPGDGSAYDASRIAILERMADHIWQVKPEAFVILEHFADNSEEKILVNYENGMLVWGNANYNFNEATMGYHESGNSDFSWASYQKRGFQQPGLVTYMESHDEERLMYKNLTYGNSSGDYDITTIPTALKRNALAASFFFSLPGPKMIWQFGEFGYDVSIDYNDRVGEKPLKWDYLDDPERMKLFDIYSAMLRLRDQFPVFTSGTETLDLDGELKTIQLALEDHHITLIGNFGMTGQTITAPFQHTGTWNDFFTGENYTVSATSMPITLQAGEYHLYSDQELPAFKSLATNISERFSENTELLVYPNPTEQFIHVKSNDDISLIYIYSVEGKLIQQLEPNMRDVSVDLSSVKNGIYLMQVKTSKDIHTQKFIKK